MLLHISAGCQAEPATLIGFYCQPVLRTSCGTPPTPGLHGAEVQLLVASPCFHHRMARRNALEDDEDFLFSEVAAQFQTYMKLILQGEWLYKLRDYNLVQTNRRRSGCKKPQHTVLGS